MSVRKFLEQDNLIYYFLLFSVCMKIALLILFPLFNFPDSRAYITGGIELYNNNFIWPNSVNNEAPLGFYYYAIFAPLQEFFGIKAFSIGNIFISSAIAFLCYKIAREIFGVASANITATIVIIYPYFNFYAIHILLETPYMFFIYLSFYFAIKAINQKTIYNVHLFTLFFTLGILTRFAGLPMYPILLLLLLFFIYRFAGFGTALKSGLISIFVFLAIMSPWWIRNYSVHGEFVATSIGESGKVFYTGNNPMNKSGGGITGIDVDFSSFDHIKDLKEKDEAMKKAAIEWIKENPLDWIVLEVRKLIRLYSPVIFTDYFDKWYFQMLSITTYGPIFILFLISFYYRRDAFMLSSPMFLYLILLTGVHLVFIASLRYRLPLEPYMIIMASGVLAKFFKLDGIGKS